ncbi:MAG: type I-D CRISPR-associated helicase Cas3' [Cyanobacteria bacterium SID2]|nr:type I-D CRISPR-associated helicase Cas3' [Cyanobacteria bacterium SID2]
MTDYRITLKPIFSAPADVIPEGVKLPKPWSWMWHQAETYQALKDPNIDVIINTAMTGDGKSFAGYSTVLLDGNVALGMYPTNELARDQERQIGDYVATFQPPNEPRFNRLSGAELELFSERENLSKADAIARRGKNSEILLSNPDIIHYLHRGAYLTRYDNPDKLWNRIDKNFDLFIFDEFHVFAPPQVASVINTMLLIRNTNRRKKFLFLSATPDPQLLEKLELAKFRYRVINPEIERKYEFPDSDRELETLQSQGYRQIAGEIEFNFISLESTAQASEIWLKENIDRILQHFLEQPGSKGAIILNSIASVKRLVPRFREYFEPHGLTVGENTGLSGKQTKLNSLDADLVIGTSTIDVGVDFKINLLFFESSDAGNFVQRLGRLGRHEGYDRDGKLVKFNQFTAYALVPKFLVERLFEKENAALEPGGQFDRTPFNAAIRDEYRQINDFCGYYQKWGAVQSIKLYFDLNAPKIREQYTDSRQEFRRDCEAAFKANWNRSMALIKQGKEQWNAISGKSNNPIAEEAWSFRGSSPLQCGLYDETEPYELDRFKTYDLPGILSNLEIEMWTEAGFLRRLQETSDRLGEPIAKGRFKHCLGFMRLKGYREERLNWQFTYPGKLESIANAWKVQVLAGVQIWQPDNPWIWQINQRLKKQALVCYVLPLPATEVRQRLRLPMHFAIYPISDETSVHATIPPYSISIGQAALMVDVLAAYLKSRGGETWIA